MLNWRFGRELRLLELTFFLGQVFIIVEEEIYFWKRFLKKYLKFIVSEEHFGRSVAQLEKKSIL